jgi:microcystin-dependent protein
MTQPFVAEIRIMAFNFAPTGWAFCAGQLIPISQNTALFSLLGTFYGGDGKSNFALPNLQGSVPMHYNQGPGLSDHFIGETGGEQVHQLLQTEMPSHTHLVNAQDADGVTGDPTNNFLAHSAGNAYVSGASNSTTSPLSTSNAGSSVPHNNLMPYLTLNFCIAIQGVFPSRT